MTWSKDALVVKFSHSKNDQEGDNGCEAPKHVYSNPANPSGCPILSLALYLLVTPRSNERHVFIGSVNMANTQRVAIQKACEGLRSELASLGHEPSDFGTHSDRKGATTHCASDTEDGPPLMAVFLRGGWRIAGPKEVYVKFALRGDQAVGRVASGLNLSDPAECTQVAPYFTEEMLNSPSVKRALALCFPWSHHCSSRLQPVLLHCVASLVYHHSFLTAALPTTHPYRRSAFYQEEALVQELDAFVLGGKRNTLAQNLAQATGILANVHILAKLEMLEAGGGEGGNLFEKLREFLRVEGLIAPYATRAGVEKLLEDQNKKLEQLIASRLPAARPATERGRVWWEEKVPEDFALPPATLDEGWRMWWRGSPASNLSPIRHLRPQDVKNKRQREALTPWRKVMRMLEKACTESNLHVSASASPVQLQACIDGLVAHSILPPAVLKRNGRTVRPRERTVLTIHKLLKRKDPSNTVNPFLRLFI
ncbi:hypothetical protein FVE85_7728 [Porphyridium purpureum]|uniref:Uncharacterized protein n=1 Tax=Porphyridium purpureum TaxID=35688 RepID=A0A5J4YLI4_PORPP|nr:hypothetical protein FVE85_7728 [Porphyridium purpureum]|eukprot:POR3319..scf210_14